MKFREFEELFTGTGFKREVVMSQRGEHQRLIMSWFNREKVSVTVNGDTVVDNVSRVCLVDKGDFGVFVYVFNGFRYKFVLVDLVSFVF